IVRIALPVATIAFCGPRRRAMRRCRAPRKPVPVRAAVAAMLPRVAASHGSPLMRPLFLRLPADSWVCGQNLAQDTRWAADGNRLMLTENEPQQLAVTCDGKPPRAGHRLRAATNDQT